MMVGFQGARLEAVGLLKASAWESCIILFAPFFCLKSVPSVAHIQGEGARTLPLEGSSVKVALQRGMQYGWDYCGQFWKQFTTLTLEIFHERIINACLLNR